MHVYTHDHYRDSSMVAAAFATPMATFSAVVYSLSTFNSEADFTRELAAFFSDSSCDAANVFVVQCVATECHPDHIEHTKVRLTWVSLEHESFVATSIGPFWA